ncbi:Uncharacterised protein [Shigella sonnei]|nr:Uncharacterised protein [Shigella sonnei]CSP51798.1 Uncharacterised protein [Shigella sonnei]CSP67554.1 Uncharacterised protein [Shigella sonnei]CSP78923.1 Uncharacterised protein [Shigella sonnei]CSQ43024.1 Uncharacterised protein [Shigella sonnei]
MGMIFRPLFIGAMPLNRDFFKGSCFTLFNLITFLFVSRIDAIRKQLTWLVTTYSGIRECDFRINPKCQHLLLSLITVLQTPVLRTIWMDKQMHTATISQLILLICWLSCSDFDVC